MRREEFKMWLLDFFSRHSVTGKYPDVPTLAEALARELPGVVVGDDYIPDMDEMLSMHATYLEAQHQIAKTALKDDRRPDGKQRVSRIVEEGQLEEKRAQVADLQIAIEERLELKCSGCGTAPPWHCKFDCAVNRYR